MLYISSVLCLLYLSGKGVIENTVFLGQVITAGTLVSFYSFISKFFNPIQNLAEQFNRLQSAFASAEKIFTVLDMKPEVVDSPDAIELDEVKGEIEFRDVWFAYKPDEWVLRGVSFKVEAKSTVAFVGATGSGKTTILSLLCRNWDIERGEILVDGINIKGYIDGELMLDYVADNGTKANAYQVVSVDEETGDIIIKLVNVTDKNRVFAIDIASLGNISGKATVSQVAGDSLDNDNILGAKEACVMEEFTIEGISESFNYTAPMYSVTAIRIHK